MPECQHDWFLPTVKTDAQGCAQLHHVSGSVLAVGCTPNAEISAHAQSYYQCKKCQQWIDPCRIGYHRMSVDPLGKIGYGGKVCWNCTPSIYFSSIGAEGRQRLSEAAQVYDPDYKMCPL